MSTNSSRSCPIAEYVENEILWITEGLSVDMDDYLSEDGIDLSLEDIEELASSIEFDYNIYIDTEIRESWETPRDMVDYVREKTNYRDILSGIRRRKKLKIRGEEDNGDTECLLL